MDIPEMDVPLCEDDIYLMYTDLVEDLVEELRVQMEHGFVTTEGLEEIRETIAKVLGH